MAPLLLIGGAIGAAAMYLLDPDRGARRRALLRDQAVKAAHGVTDFASASTRDLGNRSFSVVGRARSLLRRRKDTDDVLVERVRSKMGRYVGHPRAIEVTASGGHVTLSGAVLAHEHKELLEAVRGVAGVNDIIDRLVVHKTAEGISELQGGRRRRDLPELLQENWLPGTRLVVGGAGATLALYATRLGIPGLLLGVAGALILLRSTTNLPLRRLVGRSGHRAIDLQKTIHIAAPVEQVFAFVSNYENFPRFMRNVRSVELRDNGQSHWTVAGPAGTTVQWTSVTTRFQPNEHIAWRTLPDSPVQHAGMIYFTPEAGGTRMHIEMSYNPPAGALGHVVAKLFGADPKTELDEDLMRLKTGLETGKPPRDAAQPGVGTAVSG